MRQLLILADDLSGAADCANACMSSGLTAAVTFEETDQHCPADVLSVDCDTRHLPSHEATDRVARFMRAYNAAQSDSLLVKKVDSSLRGNVGAEVASALAERRSAADRVERIVAVMAPAFPKSGRTTVDGYQLAHRMPLHETEMWVHDRIPGTAHIPSLLAKAGIHPASLDLRRVRSGMESLRRSMLESAVTADVLVCDAETDEDLHAIASASLSLGRKTVWAGSAGLAYHLSLAAGLVPKGPPASLPDLRKGPILFVIGSMSSISQAQASHLVERSNVNMVCISPRTLLAGSDSPDWAQLASEIDISLRGGRDTLVKVDGDERVELDERRRITDALGVMLSPHREIAGALVASGGETARAVLAGWGVTTLQIFGEVETGVPCSIGSIGKHTTAVLTKAGSFGRPETLLNCRKFLDKLERGAGSVRISAHKP